MNIWAGTGCCTVVGLGGYGMYTRRIMPGQVAGLVYLAYNVWVSSLASIPGECLGR